MIISLLALLSCNSARLHFVEIQVTPSVALQLWSALHPRPAVKAVDVVSEIGKGSMFTVDCRLSPGAIQ